jgi:hypothetical protein
MARQSNIIYAPAVCPVCGSVVCANTIANVIKKWC